MKVLAYPKKLHVILQPGDEFDKHNLMGWRQKRGDPKIIAEDNLVNRMVLGQALTVPTPYLDLQYPEGLLPYQVQDVSRMLSMKHFLNANPMGLGKTPETVRFLKEVGAKTALIVTPKIIRTQWVDQLEKWGGFHATIYEDQPYITEGIWVINYEKLRNEKTRLKFRRFSWDVLVLDEAHKIKGRKSAQARAVKELPAQRRVALTGTPILRYVDDLWSILDFLDSRYAGSDYYAFRDYFGDINRDEWGSSIVGLSKDPARVAMLNKLMSLFTIRNQALEVAHGKTREIIRLPMAQKQRTLYRKEKQLCLDELPENCTIANGATLTLRMRQTTSWPGLYIPKEPGPKFEWILETCKNHPDEKFVVFSCFEHTISALVDYLGSNGISVVSITGKKTAEECERSKRLFVDRNIQVLAGTIGAMGQGYDELQKVCRLMIMIDRDWSPEIMNQAEDRLHRMGQRSPVTVYYLECQGSFDQYVGRINERKANDIREALQDERI